MQATTMQPVCELRCMRVARIGTISYKPIFHLRRFLKPNLIAYSTFFDIYLMIYTAASQPMHSHQDEDEEKLGDFLSENAAALAELHDIARQFTSYIPTVKRASSALYLNHYLPFCFNILNLFLDKLYALCADHKVLLDAATLTALISLIFKSIQISDNQCLFLMQLHDFVRDHLTANNFHLDERFQDIFINAAQDNFIGLYCGRMILALNTLSGENKNNSTELTPHGQKIIFNSLHNHFTSRISDSLVGLSAELKSLGSELREAADQHDRLATHYELLQISIREFYLSDLKEKNKDLKLRNLLKHPSLFTRKNINLQKLREVLDNRIVLQEKMETLLQEEKDCLEGLVKHADTVLTAVNNYNCLLPEGHAAKEGAALNLIMCKALASLEKYKPKFLLIQDKSPSHQLKK
jgi:hypothetical protein